MIVRNRLLADEPSVNFPVGCRQQSLELVQACFIEFSDVSFRERPHEQVHFPESSSPGPELQFSATFIHLNLLSGD